MYKLLQEYNSGLQLYNGKLKIDLDTAHENVKRGEKEKGALFENLSTFMGQYSSLKDQYNSCKSAFRPQCLFCSCICSQDSLLSASGQFRVDILYLLLFSLICQELKVHCHCCLQ